MLTLELPVRPPPLLMPIAFDGLGEELVAVVRERRNIDVSGLERPISAAAGLVAQIVVLVCGANEDALARLDHLLTAVARPVALGLTRDEALEQRGFDLAHGVHL